jgi:hypothetical protein
MTNVYDSEISEHVAYFVPGNSSSSSSGNATKSLQAKTDPTMARSLENAKRFAKEFASHGESGEEVRHLVLVLCDGLGRDILERHLGKKQTGII